MDQRKAVTSLEYAKLWIEKQGKEGENNSLPGKFRALTNLKEVLEWISKTHEDLATKWEEEV